MCLASLLNGTRRKSKPCLLSSKCGKSYESTYPNSFSCELGKGASPVYCEMTFKFWNQRSSNLLGNNLRWIVASACLAKPNANAILAHCRRICLGCFLDSRHRKCTKRGWLRPQNTAAILLLRHHSLRALESQLQVASLGLGYVLCGPAISRKADHLLEQYSTSWSGRHS